MGIRGPIPVEDRASRSKMAIKAILRSPRSPILVRIGRLEGGPGTGPTLPEGACWRRSPNFYPPGGTASPSGIEALLHPWAPPCAPLGTPPCTPWLPTSYCCPDAAIQPFICNCLRNTASNEDLPRIYY